MSKPLSLVLALVCAGGLAASELRDNVGIGLGTMLFEGHNGLISQASAGTTNGLLGNQTFAITSGTSEAREWKSWWAGNAPARNFVRDNMDAVARDMAAGQGEALDTLIELMAVPAESRTYTARAMQSNFTKIFTSAEVTHIEVLDNLAPFVPKA